MYRDKKRERLYFMKQKIYGAILALLGAGILIIDNSTGMAASVITFLGVMLIFTKDKVVMIDGWGE